MSAEAPATPADRPWRCPHCRSSAIVVFYNERRTCGVTSGPGGADEPYPWPSYEPDEHVDIDPDSFSFECSACGEVEIEPTQEERP